MPDLPSQISLVPELLQAARRVSEGEAILALSWSILRAVETRREGLLLRRDAVEALMLRTKRRRANTILDEGEGRYWHSDSDPGTGEQRIWLNGTARVATALGVERLTSDGVLVPLGRLRGRGVASALAAASTQSTKTDGRQTSRALISLRSGVGRASQRRLEQTHGFSGPVRQVRRKVASATVLKPGARFRTLDITALRSVGGSTYVSGFYIIHRESDVRRADLKQRHHAAGAARRHINQKLKQLLASTTSMPLPDRTDGGLCVSGVRELSESMSTAGTT